MEQTRNIESSVIKEIVTGKYRNSYLIYNRKSTDDVDNQKNSIKYQKAENLGFAFREQLSIASVTLEGFVTDGIVSERHSGFKEHKGLIFGKNNSVQYRIERPKFHQLVKYLSQGYFKGVIFLCWDRASRNKGDDTILRKLMNAGVDMRFSLAKYDKTSAGELHMDIDSMFAEHHSRVTREKVKKTMENARARGLCTHKAGVGYVNQGNMEHKPIDPIRGPLIRNMAELAATGEWSLADLARWLIDRGFTMPPMRRQRTQCEILAEEEDDIRLDVPAVSHLPTFTTVYKILTNPFYTGKIPLGDGSWIPSTSHEAIIPSELFDRVQVALKRKRVSAHYAEKMKHPLRGVARCGICGRVYTPYTKKGILYYSARCAQNCSNPRKNMRFSLLAENVGLHIRKLSFTQSELDEIDARTITDIAFQEARHRERIEDNTRRRKRVQDDIDYLCDNKLALLKSGAYTPQQIVEQDTRLQVELQSLSGEDTSDEASIADTLAEGKKLSELLKTLAISYDLANPDKKDRIIRIVFSELSFADNMAAYQCSGGILPFKDRMFANGGLMEWLSELPNYYDEIKSSINALEELLNVHIEWPV